MIKQLTLAVLAILTCGVVHALPVGNPSDASLLCDGLIWEGYCGDPCDPCLTWWDAFSIRVGFYGDYVFNRHMEVDNHANGSDIEDTEIYTNAALIVANFWDRLDVFGTVGATNLWIDTNSKAFGLGSRGRFVIETGSAFSWSVGVRGTLMECGCTSLGAEAQYAYAHPHITRLTQNATTSVYPGSGVSARYWEGQVGVGLAHRINIFVPYVAIQWARARIDMDHEIIPGFIEDGEIVSAELFGLKNKNGLSSAVGISLIDCEKASLTVEGRFGGEKALHVNGQIRF